MSNQTVKVSEFINTEYRAYSLHTITSRAIPLLFDGLKSVQRKILFTAIKECPRKEVKVATLGGMLPKIGAYHHGSASGEEAIIKMAQDFNNNVCLLEGRGSFGSRPVPVPSAARYINTILSDNYRLFFTDDDVLPMSLDADDHPEPFCYLPLIPFSLVNGADGIAVGAATKFLPRNPRDIALACKEYLVNGTIKSQLRPHVKGFRGKFKKGATDGKYTISGTIKHIGTNGSVIQITELPLGIRHEAYIEKLDAMRADANPIFTSYVDDTDHEFNFTLKLSKYGKTLSDEELMKALDLEKAYTENMVLTTFNDLTKIPDDNTQYVLSKYDSPKQVVKEFVDFRILFFDERIKYNIERINAEIEDLSYRVQFVESVVDGSFILKDKTRKQLVAQLTKTFDASYAEKFVSMSLSAFTKDNIQKMKARIKDATKELKYWEGCNAKDLFIEDLDTLITNIT